MDNIREPYSNQLFSGQVNIKKRPLLQWFVILVAFWSVLFKPVSSLPGALGYLKYLPDGILLVLLVLLLGRNMVAVRRPVWPMCCIMIGFFFYTLVIYLLCYQSIAYYLWGFRNNFRFYIAFFAFIAYLDETDADTWVKAMDALFWVNVILSVFQFFVLGVRQDFLGGIFGIQGASNGFSLCFMSIVVGKTLLEAFDGTEKLSRSMGKCVASIFVAALAEMKFFFFVLIFLMVGATVMTHFSVKKTFFLMLVSATLMIGAVLLVEIFDSYGFFSLESLWKSATKENYSSQADINRLSAIPTLSRKILTDPVEQLFGLGLGNCDTSAFAICNTPFYRQYSYLHYTWFVSAMVFLETGYVGLVLYISFFVACFVQTYKQYKAKIGNPLYSRLALLMAVLSCILIVYNSSMRIEAAYMMYFVLALPFIQKKSEMIENYGNDVIPEGGKTK